MGERPIIFTGDSVRAILAGRKTQSRRVISPMRIRLPHAVCGDGPWTSTRAAQGTHPAEMNRQGAVSIVLPDGRRLGARPGEFNWACPYADGNTSLDRERDQWVIAPNPGSRLYVKESFARVWAHADGPSDEDRVEYRASMSARRPGGWDAERDAPKGARWMSPRFMPRALSRITLEILSVRVERVQAISPDDAIAEGVERVPRCGCEVCARLGPGQWCPADAGAQVQPFAEAWDAINGRRAGCSWADNPHVWCLSFRRVEAP